jgi:NADH dehydrogenase FAD-containing subunit
MTESNQPGRPTVVVVGGGYGGIAVAKALDETSDVVLVEPKDAFMHNIAALRALVDPSWLPRIFLPYAGLLTNGRVVRDRAVVVDPHRVVTACSPLRQAPPTEPGELGTFTVTTEAGTEVSADIWFRCYGVVPNSDYLRDALVPARRSDGFIEVGPTLQVAGQTTVFAVGDISTADSKMAGFAGRQAATVADNINALAQGRSDLTHYESWGVAIAVPLGPTGGAGQFPGQDEIVGRETIAEVKGREMGVDRLGEIFGLWHPRPPDRTGQSVTRNPLVPS